MANQFKDVSTHRAPTAHPLFSYVLYVLTLLACVGSSSSHAALSLPFALGAPFVSQEPLDLSSADRLLLKQRGALKVGISIADYEPVDITTDRNRYQGISADYLSLITARLSMPVEVVGFAKREQAVAALHDGTIDLLTSANGFERGVPGLAFTHDYLADRAVVVGRGQDESLLPSLKGNRVVLLDGYADADVVHQVYPDSEIILAPSLYSAMEALAHGEVDAFIGNEVIVRAYNSLRPYLGLQIKFASKLPPTGFSFALRATDQRLLKLADQALIGLDESVSREIQGRWTVGLGADIGGQRIRLSPSEQQWVRKNSRVIVASTQHPPYIYKDRNGRWVGLNVDVLARISRMTGINFVHEEMPSTKAALEALSSGRAEMNTTLAESLERKQMLDFTYAFGGNSWVFVVRSDNPSQISLPQMSGKVLAMPARHALLEFLRENYPDVLVREVATYDDARKLVEDGRADATIQNETGAWLYPPGKLKVGRSVEGKWSPDRFSVIKGEPELLSVLNKALEEFPVAEMRAIRLKWLGAIMPQPSLWQRIPAWVYWALTLALLLGLVSLAWNSRLKFQIRQRVRAEEQLSDQLAFKRALLDGIPNPIYVRDLQGRLISCNRSYEESFNISFEQLNGRRLIDVDLIPPDTAEQMHADYMALLKTQEPVFADRSMVLAGRPIEAWQWTVPFYRADGQLQGLLGGWIDITERKRLERELTQAQQAAEAANRAKSNFLATMSHDIRTPMSVITGLLELELEHSRLRGQPCAHGVKVAHDAACELLELIGESLDLAKIESGKLQLSSVPTDLSVQFDNVHRLFASRAAERGLALTLDIAPQAHGYYWIDPLRLRQILHNLIGNSLKFTSSGSVSVSVAFEGEAQGKTTLSIEVRDTGSGMSQAQQAQLFQPFTQGDAHVVRQFAGSGLGLSICKQLVELMAGQISVTSAVGEGTCVEIKLSLMRAEPPVQVQAVAAEILPAVSALDVLIVDDLSANLLVLRGQLELLGHQVTAVAEAEVALQHWRNNEVDVLITDCNMPGLSGYGLTQAIRAIERDEHRRPTPIIGCTANAMSEEWHRCEEAGMDTLLIKPVSLAQLSRQIEEVVGGSHVERQLDMQALRRMTQADTAQMQRMLGELWKNLHQERDQLASAVAHRDWKAIGAVLHRLKGVACLVDAVPLARACAQLDANVRQESQSGLQANGQVLDTSIAALLGELEKFLSEEPLL